MKKSTMMMAVALAIGLGGSAQAEERSWAWSPVGIGIAAPIQIPFVESDVYGLRLGGLFGYNHDVYGLDLGVAEVCSGGFRGLQVSALSWVDNDNVYGVQAGALANVVNACTKALQVAPLNVVWEEALGAQLGLVNVTTEFCGLQLGGLVNWNDLASYGLQLGAVNANQQEFYGWAFGGLVNYADSFDGFACGFVNVAYDVKGCQLGVFNACDHMHGVQIGLVNMICGSKLPIMVIANAWF